MWVRAAAVWLGVAAALCAVAGPGPPARALRFQRAHYNLTVPENSPPRAYCSQLPHDPPLGLRLPAPNARLRYRIRHGDKDKFFKAEERTVGDFSFLFIRTRAGLADVLNRERRDSYTLEVRATATLPPTDTKLEADVTLHITVTDENDLSPLFYPTDYEAVIREDAPAHSSVAKVAAEDADLGLNGEIYYSLAEPAEPFVVHLTTGVVTNTRPLRAAERVEYVLTVIARDRASLLFRGEEAPAARATLHVRVEPANLHAPELHVRRAPAIPEDASNEVYAVVEATDRDEGDHGRVSKLEIIDGDPDGHFRVRAADPPLWEVVIHALLDRERAPKHYNLTLRATDAGIPARSSYLTLPISLVPVIKEAPVFSREVYEASVSETAPPRTPLIRLRASEKDEGRARVYFEIVGGNEGGEFQLNADTGVIYTATQLDTEARSLYTLTVSAVDHGEAGARHQSSAKVKITVLDANDNAPVFEQEELTIEVDENGTSGAVVARVAARDADSGENAYVSYSLANLQPVPFEVDHFSGTVRATRPLDYETMRREYVLRIRAGDWGLPYRRQAEMKLTVRVRDVNDNRPQFERVDCVGHLPRRTAPGHELLTLSAIDFDAGDVVSYRIIGGNDDGCFALDTATGVLSIVCDLREVRGDLRVLNVTATDGTHFADEWSLTLHVGAGSSALECRETGVARRLAEQLAAAERSNAPEPPDETPPRRDDNLHAPEFVDFPVEVKVNESVALGASLVTLHARDRDRGYSGLLVYAISAGDDDSVFRVDPDSGQLSVIGRLDREREAEYYLNVTVYDLGKPPRSASRMLPVTVLDANDNAPRFLRSLASVRVAENALNGTEVFAATAEDADSGVFGQVSYSLSGEGSGEFCVDHTTGVVRVCASLDREKRALYEVVVRATDGGGLWSEAAVRVEVDDVNDCAPKFALTAWAARVAEDAPIGTAVAIIAAVDPDEGPGGDVTYSLPDAVDAPFTVDSRSGVLRTTAPLDYEQKQVWGVRVRATDGGVPALWSEAVVVIEVVDVDENAHTPRFSDRALSALVREDAAIGTAVITAAAADADSAPRDSRLAYYLHNGSGLAHFTIDDKGVIRTSSPLDRESAPHYWLTACAHDHALAPKHACVQIYIDVENVNDIAPWFERAWYAARVPEHCAAGTHVAYLHASDGDASDETPKLRYSIVAGNPDGLFAINHTTGALVTSGRALDREAAATHALEVRCSDGELFTTVRVHVTVEDINDHAPAFTHTTYEFRTPASDVSNIAQNDDASPGSESLEWDSDSEDEDGSGANPVRWQSTLDDNGTGFYVGTVLALDPDHAANGTVTYSARGGHVLRVHPHSGRIMTSRPLRLNETHHLTIRACDGGTPVRCGATRVYVRGANAGAGGTPRVDAPLALQVAELDAPGSLLTQMRATHTHNRSLYYDIVDGNPRGEFVIGAEDGSVVLARRLRHETQPKYALNVSVSDGSSTVYTTLSVSVINDVSEEGVWFSQDEYSANVSLRAATGARILSVAAIGAPRLLYGIHAARAPASQKLFHLHELTGALHLAAPLYSEGIRIHELVVWARDQAPRASRAFARVTIQVQDDEGGVTWGRRLAEVRVPRGTAVGDVIVSLRAGSRSGRPIQYSLAGGDSGALWSVDPDLGDVKLARSLPVRGPTEYAMSVRAAVDTASATLPLHIVIVGPDDAPPTLLTSRIVSEVWEGDAAGTVVATVDARSATAVRWEVEGGDGMFRVNPSHGVLTTAAPLDYEAVQRYNLTMIATNMGGGSASCAVEVHVLDRNEFAPTFLYSQYLGEVAESAPPGALVLTENKDTPLVLETKDEDSPSNRQRSYHLSPEVEHLFAVDPTTGALRIKQALDYETQSVHSFTVKVVDEGWPRVWAASTATVTVRVGDVNDCAPTFDREQYEASVLAPTLPGVVAIKLLATDPDPPNVTLTYSIVEGDDDNAWEMTSKGELRVTRADSLAALYKLRVRASDGLLWGETAVTVRVKTNEAAGLAFSKGDYFAAAAENSTRRATVAPLTVLGAALDEHVTYSILNPVPGFEIGVTSGVVRTTGVPLDREAKDQYTLLIAAKGDNDRAATARLQVTVTDVNDNCPVFVHQPYVAAARPNDPPGSVLLHVTALDADAGDNGQVRYEMLRGEGELFRIERGSGDLVLKQSLGTRRNMYTLVVAAFDGGVPACRAEASVRVRIWPDLAPAWEKPHYTVEASENVKPGSTLATLRAESPSQRPLIYTIVEAAPPPAPQFQLHFDTAPSGNNPCVLIAVDALDYEQWKEHILIVRATDGGGEDNGGAVAEVRIVVSDANDHAPSFPHATYHVNVSEASPPGTRLTNIIATDPDQDDNGRITYSLRSANDDDLESLPFFVEGESGWVVVSGSLDADTHPKHVLLLTATDAGKPSLNSTVRLYVNVLDVNDNAPILERTVVSALVSSEASPGTVVARVAAWDPDVIDAEALEYAAGGRAPYGLAVDPHSGVIRVSEARAMPTRLNVTVSDGAHAVTARVEVSPAPVNRAPPRFPHVVHEARAPENKSPGLLLTTLRARDDDPAEYGKITYSIPSALHRSSYQIDPTSGALTTLVQLDRESRPEWEVGVAASDGGGLRAHTVVRVRVADENDNAPQFALREYRCAVRADRAPHHAFCTVNAKDLDIGDNARVTYSMRSSDEPTLLVVQPDTGAVSLARNATGHEGATIRAWIDASDGGGKASHVPLAVRLLRSHETTPPHRAPPPDIFLPEDASLGTVLLELGAEGSVGGAVEYSVVAGGGDDDVTVAQVDNAGRVTLATPLDRERATDHVLGVLLRRKDTDIAVTVTARLRLLDVNDNAPVFQSEHYVVNVAENTPIDTDIMHLVAEDVDAGVNGEVRYSLRDDGGGAFAVDAHSGWLRIVTSLDREVRAEYSLVAVAEDAGTPKQSASCTVTVRLVDYNDCPPKFEGTHLATSVREDAPPGTVVTRLAVTDADETTAPLSFLIANGDTRARFEVRASGELVVARSLDRETQDSHSLRVIATDGKFSAETDVDVTVTDVNDNGPVCTEQRVTARVSEDAEIGAALVRVEVVDADTPAHANNRRYLTGHNHHHFNIDQETGVISVAATLDRETQADYLLTAHAVDRDRPKWQCATELRIILDDVNDNAPVFPRTEYRAILPEDAPTGTLVSVLRANDPDAGQNRALRYSIHPPDDVFQLDAETGVITLRLPLDRETKAEHLATIRVVDGGRPTRSATTTLKLTVADVNDNPPEFELETYHAAPSELLAVGAELIRVRALSRDSGPNAEVKYSLIAGDGREDFSMDSTNGILVVAKPLDYERQTNYILTVQAIDAGEPPLSDLAQINITVKDANDNAPRFLQSSYGARVREDSALGSNILQVIAEDADSGANGRLVYSIARGDPTEKFGIDADTGYITVASPLDRETTPAYVLEVRAKDRGVPSLETSTTVNVEVLDANDNPPMLEKTEYSAVVHEGRPLGHAVLRLVVTDLDAAPNGAPFTFDLLAGNEAGAFRLEADGSLRTAARFNHRIRDEYVLHVRVFDNGAPPLYSDARVTVRVVEESQYPPAVTPLDVQLNSYLDEFPGGEIGRVRASDRDPYDTLQFALAAAPPGMFSVDSATGTLTAEPRLDMGEYRLNVTVTDGRFASWAPVKVNVVLITDEMLAQTVTICFRAVADSEFVLSHRKGFIHAIREATDVSPNDVIIVSVQPAGIAQHLDVAIAVRDGVSGYLPADALRRRLHAHLERVEERARLVVEELVRAQCGGCAHGACVERVEVRSGGARVVATDVYSLVAPPHRVSARCHCEPGYAGERCSERDLLARDGSAVVQLSGDGYLEWNVPRGTVWGARTPEDELVVSMRVRTLRPRGTLLWLGGTVDFAVLEVVDGRIQFRMELGAGEVTARADTPVSDGRWHDVRLKRRGAAVRLTVGRRAATATAPPPNAVLDVKAHRLVLGGTPASVSGENEIEGALTADQVWLGFEGCVSDVRLSGAPLPLVAHLDADNDATTLAHAVRVAITAECAKLTPPSVCSSYPCFNGGRCREVAEGVDGSGFMCECSPRYLGDRCEIDTQPCSSLPCLHGGTCVALGNGYRCSCPVGLSGPRCERGRYCSSETSGEPWCLHGGACEEGLTGASCACRGWWGARCQHDVDECAGEPCLNGATCLNEPGSFRCLCPPHTTGMNCGNPLYSDAVTAGGASADGALRELWAWALAVKWPLAVAALLLLVLLVTPTAAVCVARAKQRSRHAVRLEHKTAGTKLSNLEAARAVERPTPGTNAGGTILNNVDTLRSYGSAGEALENPPIPADYRRNLQLEPPPDKLWSDQMHLHTFHTNKIYNDLKGSGGKTTGAGSMEPRLVGGYHWDCSDWCGAPAPPYISEVAGSERRDSSSGGGGARGGRSPLPSLPAPTMLPLDTDSPLEFDNDLDALTDASSSLLGGDGTGEPLGRISRRRDANSLITLLEERSSLVGSDEDSGSDGESARLCDIEDSGDEAMVPPPHAYRTGSTVRTDL